MSAKLPDRFTILYYLASMNHRREFFFSWTIKKEQITFEYFYILYNECHTMHCGQLLFTV